jgi:hypothetical protein
VAETGKCANTSSNGARYADAAKLDAIVFSNSDFEVVADRIAGRTRPPKLASVATSKSMQPTTGASPFPQKTFPPMKRQYYNAPTKNRVESLKESVQN